MDRHRASLSGPNLTFSTACSSSAVAIGEAWLRIRSGAAPVMLAGGAEAPLTFGTLKAWEALKTLAAEDPVDPSASCKPFAKDRSGLVLGEGAAMLVLEEWEHAAQRGATVHGEIAGYGLCTDVAHITRPTVEGQARAMRLALESAGCAPDAIGYINAHGTGDAAERRRRDRRDPASLRRTRGRDAGELDQIDARPSARRGRRGGARRDTARGAHRHDPADDEPAHAGSGVRSRLRAERRAARARHRARDDELVRVRRDQRGAGLPPSLTRYIFE